MAVIPLIDHVYTNITKFIAHITLQPTMMFLHVITASAFIFAQSLLYATSPPSIQGGWLFFLAKEQPSVEKQPTVLKFSCSYPGLLICGLMAHHWSASIQYLMNISRALLILQGRAWQLSDSQSQIHSSSLCISRPFYYAYTSWFSNFWYCLSIPDFISIVSCLTKYL